MHYDFYTCDYCGAKIEDSEKLTTVSYEDDVGATICSYHVCHKHIDEMVEQLDGLFPEREDK